MKFTEYDGMILRESPESAAKNISMLKEKGQWRSQWQYERGANHTHADMSAIDREHVRQELEIAAEFATALRQAYPDRAFLITHIPCYAVSFYQATGGAPAEGILPLDNASPADETWCQTCQHNQSYTPLPSPDVEFPEAEWGRCIVCGNDLITHYGEILTLLPAVSQ